jgi:hypothetical protein
LLLANDETDSKRLGATPTLNHNHRKPYIPPPPALPRFALPNEASDAMDPLDAAVTAQRPALTAGSRRRIVRRVQPQPDATSEVAVEDILLEAYAEDPPPPPSRRARVESVPASVKISAAIASVVPPPSAQSAAVDALLRASDPAFAPPAGFGPGDLASQSNSVAPVMLAATIPPPAPVRRDRSGDRRPNRAAVFAIWSVVLLVVSVAAGAAIVLGVRTNAYARLRDRATASSPPAVAAAAPAPAPSLAPVPAPLVAAAREAAPVPTIAVDSLPKSEIPSDMSLVTFPAAANGHRVYVDGRLVTVAADGSPAKIKCGRHLIKIGNFRRARVTDLACGREVVLQ